jgi:hypothetical protein
VKIDHTLYENLNSNERRELKQLIKQTLKGDNESLTELINFDCGGAAGCYDLGFVLTQIINKLGESKFSEMLSRLSDKSAYELEGLISVGLEYGDNEQKGKIDKTKIELAFPNLSRQFNARPR